jgi:hypothetical protein
MNKDIYPTTNLEDKYPTTNLEDKYLQRFLPHKERLKKPKLSKRENINYTIGLIIFII